MSKTTESPEFVIVLREGVDTEGKKTLEAAAACRPDKVDLSSPPHVVGSFIMSGLKGISAAALQALAPKTTAEPEQTPTAAAASLIIGPDRERTILGAGGLPV